MAEQRKEHIEMKDYKATKKEVEEFVNSVVLPSIRKTHGNDNEILQRVNMIVFLYSVGRMSALESLTRLVAIDATGKMDYDTTVGEYF